MKTFSFPADPTLQFAMQIDDAEHLFKSVEDVGKALAGFFVDAVNIANSKYGTTRLLVVAGCEITITDDGTDTTYAVTEGWAVLNNELFQVPADSIVIANASGNQAYFIVNEVNGTDEPRTLSNASSFTVRKDRTITLESNSTGDNPLSAPTVKLADVLFNSRKSYSQTLSTNLDSGSIVFERRGDVVYIRGTATRNIASSDPIGTLNVEFRPSTALTINVGSVAVTIATSGGVAVLTTSPSQTFLLSGLSYLV